MRRINYKSDIPPLLLSLKVDENQITVPDCDFIVRFYIDGYEGRHYDCSHIGGVWSNCEPSEDGTKLVCYINNQRLGIGELCAEFHYISPDRRYSDGSQKSVVIIDSTELGVELVEDNGDAVTEAAIDVTLPFIYRTAYEIARDHGYTGTAEDFYSALASVVGIADAEKKRVTAEITRNANEQERIENEENRLNAESERVNAEAQRVRNEAIRGDAESDRVEQEEDRKAKFKEITEFIATVRANEGNRESNERERQTNEDTRITEEAKRVAAEKKRAAEFEQQKLDLTGKIDRSGDEMGGDLIFTDNAGVSFRTSDGGAHTMFNDTDDVAKFTAENGDTFEFKQNETPNKNSSSVVVSANLYDALDMTLESMGSALDGDAAYRAEDGDKIFNPDTCKIQRYNSTIGGFEDLCDPIEGKLYANKLTGYIYRWEPKTNKMVFVGGVKAYTKEEADSRFAKIDDATQRVKVKELDAGNFVSAKSMWIGDEGLVLGGDGNGHLTVEQDEVITDVTLNGKLANKADDVAYGVEWNNGQPTGEMQETTIKEATRNTTVATLFLGQSCNALESEVKKKADRTELDTINANVDQKVSKTDIVQNTGYSTTSVMSQKAVSDELNRHTDKLTEVDGKVDGIEILKEDSTGKTINIEPTDYNGYINATNNTLVKTGTNYINKVYKVGGGVKYTISCSVKTISTIFANIGFVSTLPVNQGDSTDATVLLYNEKHDVSMEYTPSVDGYILILYSVNSAIYTDSMNVSYISTGGLLFIDFKSKIGDMDDLHTDDKSSLVNAINEVKSNYGSTTDLIFDNPLNKNQQTINQETINDIKDIKSTINGNNPYGTRSITAPGSSGYSNVFFDSPIPSGYTITAIDGNMGGFFIKPDGSYVEVILLRNIQLPYKLPSECGGIKVTGNGETIVTFSNGSEEKKGLTEQIDDINKEVSMLKKAPLIHIPSTIYAVVNDTIQLFYRSIVECDDIDNYYIRIDGEGSSYPRYHEVKPTSVGNKPMNVQVFDKNGNIIASREFTLNVVSQPKNPLSKTNIAFFGDSLTEGGQYPVEVKRMLTSNDVASGIMPQGKALDNIELVGAMQKSNANYYGIGGWAWSNYALNTDSGVRFYTNNLSSVVEGTRYTINGVTIQATTKRTTDQSFSAKLVSGNRVDIPSSGIFDGTNISYTSVADDTSNPLWDGSKVSFAYYFNQCGMTGDVGVISFLLGWNIVYMDFAEYTSMIRTLVTTAHQEYPNAHFALVGIQCPSNNGGLANNYPNDRFFSNKQTVIKKMHEYNEYLMDIAQDYPYVDYVDVASQFDSENNMPEVQKNVNLRNEKKEYQGTNGVHPSVNGYYQIADVLYRYIVAKLCQ